MKSLLHYSIFLLAFLIISCNKSKTDMGCDQNYPCFQGSIQYGIISLDVTINNDNPIIPIEIYEGNIDNGTLIQKDTLKSSKTDFLLSTGNRYSFKATYTSGNRTILAVNTVRLKEKIVVNCEIECVEQAKETLDLKLR